MTKLPHLEKAKQFAQTWKLPRNVVSPLATILATLYSAGYNDCIRHSNPYSNHKHPKQRIFS